MCVWKVPTYFNLIRDRTYGPTIILVGPFTALNMPENDAVTIDLASEVVDNSENDSEQKDGVWSKKKFSWHSMYKYLRETWTGVISGTGRFQPFPEKKVK